MQLPILDAFYYTRHVRDAQTLMDKQAGILSLRRLTTLYCDWARSSTNIDLNFNSAKRCHYRQTCAVHDAQCRLVKNMLRIEFKDLNHRKIGLYRYPQNFVHNLCRILKLDKYKVIT